ncbi:MAG TPA: hypothetical protein VLA31_05420 [Burkholderiaceae bacterium]|nr:hypothetical protein [Burkholderiaceae bacterium]
MAILATGNTFAVGDELTHTKLNNAVNNATFDTGAVDNATTQLSGGALIVKDGGITPAKLSTGGPSWTSGGALTATSIQNSPIGSSTASSGAFTTLSASGTTSIYETVEKAAVSGSGLTGTVNFNWLDGAVILVTANAAGNWTLNVRGDGSTTLNSSLSNGDSITLALLVTQGSTAYYQSAMQIDGSSVTPKWAGGTAPTAGNANSIDVYTFTIIKTASATYTVLASQTKFA